MATQRLQTDCKKQTTMTRQISLLTIYLLFFSSAMSYGQTNRNDKSLIFRFDLPLKAGEYNFYESEYFPTPKSSEYKPENYIPDDYFNKNSKTIQLKNTTAKYGAYILTTSTEYIYARINGKAGWIKTNIPIEVNQKTLFRNELRKQMPKKNSETDLKLSYDHNTIEIIPFNNPNFVLVHSDESFIVDLKNRKVTWQAGSYYEGPEINFKTDHLECSGDLGGGRYVFDYYGKPVEEKVTKKDLAELDSLIYSEYDVVPGSKQAAFLKVYMSAIMSNDEKALFAIYDSVKKSGVSIDSLMPKQKKHPLKATQLIANAIKENNIFQIDSILKTGFSVDSIINFQANNNSESVPLLSAAAAVDNVSLMEHLINKGANVNKKNFNNKTPLCFVQSKAAYNLLTFKGATLNKLDFNDYRKRNIYPTEYLSAKPEITNIILDTAPDSLFKHYDFYDIMLTGFIQSNDTKQINKLLKRGATIIKPTLNGVQFPSMEGQQPIYYCTDTSMFKFLVNNGAQLINIDTYGNDAHLLTFRWKNISLINWLETKGLPIQKPNNPYFVGQRDTSFMLYLIERGVSINSIDNYGNTALIRAKHFDNNPALEEFLLRHGADKTILNKKGGGYNIGRTRDENSQGISNNRNNAIFQTNKCPETIYSVTEEMPSYKNGIEDLKKYFRTSIILSDGYKTGDYKIAFEFIVDCDGSALNPYFPLSNYSDLNNQIKDAILKMGKWNAAKMMGKQVKTKVKYVLKISDGKIDLKDNS
ncbi:MAG: hypothetical protein H0U27_14310 [Nitrosopumilus sp.]|nr:hypothetical protein [Nitrosopumilus sp.]